MGYSRAGFDVVGVDIKPQPHYPFEFQRWDALEVLANLGKFYGHKFDAIHASPPCQAYSIAAKGHRGLGYEYPDLLGPTRDLLEATGLPWVIENVPAAPMRIDYKLCGCQFGLRLRRERWFESSWQGFSMMPACNHPLPAVSVAGNGTPSWVRLKWKALYGRDPNISDYREAMGIDWMNRNELSQAIPPAYTEFIGTQLLAHLKASVKS